MLGGLKRLRRAAGGLAGLTLGVAALGVAAVTTSACALIAGLQPHTLEVPDGGSGGAGGTSSTSASSTTTGGTGGAAARVWPDSSTAYCSDGQGAVPCPTKPTDPWHGQDGDFKLHVPVYETTSALVTDTVTGLMWRRAPLPAGTQTMSAQICAMPFEGFTDWRLPSRIELVTLVDYGTTGAHLDKDAFPEVAATLLVSSTLVPMSGGTTAWGVDLGCTPSCDPGNSGGTLQMFADNPNAALCVRGKPFKTGTFLAPVSGLVTDTSTGLTWQVDVDAAAQNLTWTGALQYCSVIVNNNELGGFKDWRLPSIKELQTIVDDQAVSPAIFSALHGPSGGDLWSSTPNTDVVSPRHFYTLLIEQGSTDTQPIDVDYVPARCVRGP